MSKNPVNLPELIKNHPNAVATIDNDWWELNAEHPDNNPFDEDDGNWDRWNEKNRLASSNDTFVPRLGDGGYGSGNCYGGDLLQALALIVGLKIESV